MQFGKDISNTLELNNTDITEASDKWQDSIDLSDNKDGKWQDSIDLSDGIEEKWQESIDLSDDKNTAFNKNDRIENRFDKLESKTYDNLTDMKSELGKTYTEIKMDKPPHARDIAKWFDENGTIKIDDTDGKNIWTYTDAEGKSVQYIDGKISFPPEAKHPVIKDINIGKFNGDRKKDTAEYIKKLEEEYGLTDIPSGYALHHDTENGNMQLIKNSYHEKFTHEGGHSIYKEAE